MAMKLKGPLSGRGASFNAEMNVTPFVDVMLVLLIIFMVAAPLATVSVPVDLPPSDAAATPAPKNEPIFISIQKNGAIFFGDDAVRLEDVAARLDAEIKARHSTEADERLYLRADQDLAYKHIMALMNRLQDAGYTKIGLVAEDTKN